MKARWNPDRDPLQELRQGRPESFEAFVHDRAPALRAFFRRLGAPAQEAEDLVQETFLKLYRHAAHYQPDGRFLPFAYRIARNAWIDRQRRLAVRWGDTPGGRQAGQDEERDATAELRAPGEEPDADLARREEVDRLRAALEQLSDSHRMVFELGVLQELPYADISATLDIPVGTVKSRMFHAVRKLRAALEQEEKRA